MKVPQPSIVPHRLLALLIVYCTPYSRKSLQGLIEEYQIAGLHPTGITFNAAPGPDNSGEPLALSVAETTYLVRILL